MKEDYFKNNGYDKLTMEENKTQPSKTDRVLGEEWLSWTGDLDEGKTYEETAGLFTVFAALAVTLLLGFIGAVLYMIEPRLAMISPILVFAARILTVTVITLFVLLAVLVIVCVFSGRNCLLHPRIGQVFASRILPLTLTLARRLGIPRDRLSNSFVCFSNAVVKASHKPGEGKTIILLPRCLKPEVKKSVQELAQKADVKVFTATGGGQARNIIRQERPTAVIGVACERDLISGISDVAPKIPTMGVANRRPEGPCKNTDLDIEKLRQAIVTLTGKNIV